ncbi:MAG: tyrosine-protein phosphatase, partial [Planctomycetes bacterium]|nr:tyrosine-protein phosphatase [Planctomycetota bacterium]
RRTLFKLAGGAVAIGFGAAVLRVTAFTNVHTVVPGRVYRTAQLSPERLRAFIAEKGIRTVVNLRGVCSDMPWYLGECRTSHAANINQEDITFSAKRFPAPAEVQRLVEVLDRTAYPIVFHCQRGADRTGLASTVARLLLTGDDLPTARRQLWPRYGHLAVGRTAVLDAFFDYYAEWLKARGESHAPERFRKWVATDYCPGPYRANLSVPGPGPLAFPALRGFTVTVRAENTSVEPWNFMTGGAGGFRLRYALTGPNGVPVYRDFSGHLARTVRPGEHIDLACGFPPLAARGAYVLHANLLDAQPIELLNTDFTQYGSAPLEAPVYVT